MSLFRYTFLDGNEYEIEADYYEVQQQAKKNLQGEEFTVIVYLFYENDEVKLEIPSLFVEKIREI